MPHHVDVRIPFSALPEAAAVIKAEFPDSVHYGTLRLRDYVASTRASKLYDFDEQRWLTYAAVWRHAVQRQRLTNRIQRRESDRGVKR